MSGFKNFLKDAVESDGAFATIAALSLFVCMGLAFLAFLAWVWWPLPIIALSVIGVSTALVAWANKDDE